MTPKDKDLNEKGFLFLVRQEELVLLAKVLSLSLFRTTLKNHIHRAASRLKSVLKMMVTSFLKGLTPTSSLTSLFF